MPILITRDWDAYEFVRGISAHIREKVSGVENAKQALDVAGIKKGNAFEWDSRLVAQQPRVTTPQSPQLFQIDVDFEPGGGTDSNETTEKINGPPVYRLVIGKTNEPIDRDWKRNPILNSAGDPFSSNVTKAFTQIFWEYERWEKQPNGVAILHFSNTTNKDAVDLPGFGRIGPGQGLLDPPQCLTDMTRDTEVVQMRYRAELRKEGFRSRILDKGQRAFSATGLGPIYNQKGEQISGDILLGGTGTPLDRSGNLKINATLDDPQDRTPKHWKDALIETTGLGVFVRYKLEDETPWQTLKFVK